MANIKIRVFKNGAVEPTTTVTIPQGILKIASKLIPRIVADELQSKGIDVAEILRISENTEVRGTLIEVEEHDENERVVISLE